jgi:hypothetical protein
VNRFVKLPLIFLTVAASAAILVFAGTKILLQADPLNVFFKNPNYVYVGGMIVKGADGRPIELFDNSIAVNPTYDELVTFLKTDPTDQRDYVDMDNTGGYKCADFARDIHNNAEQNGIKAAFVAITFMGEDIGHAINAFETVDQGLVFVDCTGGAGAGRVSSNAEDLNHDYPTSRSYDSIAYLERGNAYGRIMVDYAGGLTYAYFLSFEAKWDFYQEQAQAYNLNVETFNNEIKGKTFIKGSAEWVLLQQREADLAGQRDILQKLKTGLGGFCFESGDFVEDWDIRW